MYHKSGLWRKYLNYLLHAAVSYDLIQLKQEIRVYMKKQKPSVNVSNGASQTVTANDVRNLQSNPDLLQNTCMFMKNIRGTVAYFRNALHDLLAMFRSLGPPTLLSPFLQTISTGLNSVWFLKLFRMHLLVEK